MKAFIHNIKNIFVKLLGANDGCRNKQVKRNKRKATPIYRNKHGDGGGYPIRYEPPEPPR